MKPDDRPRLREHVECRLVDEVQMSIDELRVNLDKWKAASQSPPSSSSSSLSLSPSSAAAAAARITLLYRDVLHQANDTPKLHFDNHVNVYFPRIYGLFNNPPKVSKEIPENC